MGARVKGIKITLSGGPTSKPENSGQQQLVDHVHDRLADTSGTTKATSSVLISLVVQHVSFRLDRLLKERPVILLPGHALLFWIPEAPYIDA